MNTTLSSEQSNWGVSPHAPWRRYFARIFDITLLGYLSWVIIGYVSYSLFPLRADAFFTNLNYLADIILTFFTGCVMSGVFIGSFGTTPGKLIFGVRIKNSVGSMPSIVEALSREMNVFIHGLGLGIPIVSFFTMIRCYFKLKNNEHISWDKDRFTVQYRSSSAKQTMLTILGLIAYGTLLFYLR